MGGKWKKGLGVLLSMALAVTAVPYTGMAVQAEAASKQDSRISVFHRNPDLSGATRLQLNIGETFDPKSMLNRVFADDLEDGDLTPMIHQVSSNVDTTKEGTYQVSYTVTDSDNNLTEMKQEVEVGSFTDKTYQRTLYTIGINQSLLDIGYQRGYYHDRQNLGIYMPANSSLQVRIKNADEFQQNLNLGLYNNDSETENAVTIPKNGDWLEVTHTHDCVPLIETPKVTEVRPILEYRFDGAKELTFYRYGDDDKAFFQKWNQNQDAYAVIEGSAATFLVPYGDIDKIINYTAVGRVTDRFQSLDEMLDWYQDFVDQYDEFSGLDYHALNPVDQNIRSKFFIKANKHGAGQAYYSGSHSAYNGDTLQDGGQGYFCRYWLALHEFAHGYEGAIRDQGLSLVETTNNILAYYFEQTYLKPDDNGWLGDRAQVEKNAVKVRNETSSFNEITSGKGEFGVSLYMFVNALDKIGPKKNVAALHHDFRQYNQDNGKCLNAGDSIIGSFSNTAGYNMIPYFDTYHLNPTTQLRSEIYRADYEIPYYLRDLVDTDETAAQIKDNLKLKGIYDLVTATDLKDTGYQSNVTVQIEIDDLNQIKGKKLLVKDGSRVAAAVEITSKTVSLGQLPIGVYELELPNTVSGNYKYDYDFIVAKQGNVQKEVSYQKVTTNLMAEDTVIRFTGLSDGIFASISYSQAAEQITLKVEKTTPHSYFSEDYARLIVLDDKDKELYQQTFAGNVEQTAITVPIAMKEGYKLRIYYAEADRLKFYSSFTGEVNQQMKPSASKATTEYVMTKYGFVKSEWSEIQREEKYQAQVDMLLKELTESISAEAMKDKTQNFSEKLLLKSAVGVLSEDKQQEIINRHKELFYGSAPEIKELKKSLSVGKRFLINDILDVTDVEDGNLFAKTVFTQQIPVDANGNLTKEGVYPITYDITDQDNNRTSGTIRFSVTPAVTRRETKILSSELYAAAESQETGHEAYLAVDGKEDTYWQSQRSGRQEQWADITNCIRNSITIDLGSSRTVGKLEYLKAAADATGFITKYKLYYSTSEDGNDFQEIPNGEGKWSLEQGKNTAEFDVVEARRIKIKALETTDGFISGGEFYLYEVSEKILSECTCVIQNLKLTQQTVAIAFDKDAAEVPIQATAVLGGSCKLAGHGDTAITYTYQIVSNSNGIGSIVSDKLVVKGTGTVTLAVTAKANGKKATDRVKYEAIQYSSQRIPAESLTAVAQSQQGSGTDGVAAMAIDNNKNTYWHSNYSSDDLKPDISANLRNGFTINLGSTTTIHKLEYLPRDSANGRILGYQLYYSQTADQDDFVEIPGGLGTWENNTQKKVAVFEGVKARRIQIRATSTAGGSSGEENKHISAAEFYPYQLLEADAEEEEADAAFMLSYEGGTKAVGTAPAPASPVIHGTQVTLPGCSFTKPGYVFLGWSDNTAVYPAGSKYTMPMSVVVFTAQWQEKGAESCTCQVDNLKFQNETIVIPHEEEYQELKLASSAEISGLCTINRHSSSAVQYAYTIVEDLQHIGTMEGELLRVKKAGTIKIKAVASIPGTNAVKEQVAVITVKKEEKSQCTCTISQLLFAAQTIEIPSDTAKVRMPLQALAEVSGGCQILEHGSSELVYEYTEVEDPDFIGYIENGNTLVASKAGTIKIKVKAIAAGGQAITEKTAVITVTKEKTPAENCTCTINELDFKDQTIQISGQEDSRDVLLDAAAQLSGGCSVNGHGDNQISYAYTIVDNPNAIGIISENKTLTVNRSGTLKIKVKAAVAGTNAKAEKIATVTVTKAEPQCRCMITGLKLPNKTIALNANQEKDIKLSAVALLTGNCPLKGHSTRQLQYSYTILEDTAEIGSLQGNILKVNNYGTVKVKVTATIPGTDITKEYVTDFTVVAPCSCQITNLVFTGSSSQIPYNQASKAITLAASSQVSKCQAPGHSAYRAAYQYAIVGAADGAYIKGNQLTVTKAGKVNVKVTAIIAEVDVEVEKTAQFTIAKEAAPKPVTYKITFDSCGGTVSASSRYLSKGSPYGALPTPVRKGYKFKGWYSAKTGGSLITAATVYPYAAASIAYAKWELISQDVPLTQPKTVTGLKASANRTNSITISWTKQRGVTGYILYRYDTAKKKWTAVKTTSTNKYVDKKVKYGTVYKYRVKAYKKSGSKKKEGAYSKTITTAALPLRPTLKRKKISASKVSLSWNKTTKADGFEIYMRQGNGKFKKVASLSGKAKSYTKSRLTKGKKYQFKIRGYKKVGSKRVYSSFSRIY